MLLRLSLKFICIALFYTILGINCDANAGDVANIVTDSESFLEDAPEIEKEANESEPMPPKTLFAPLKNAKPSPQEAADDFVAYLFQIKYQFIAFMNENPVRKKLMDDVLSLGKIIDNFRVNPSGFLQAVGVKDNQILKNADKYLKKQPQIMAKNFYDEIGLNAEILSCMSYTSEQNIISGIRLFIPDGYYMKQGFINSPALNFIASQNVENPKVYPLFPQLFGENNGYSGSIIIPFTTQYQNLSEPVRINLTLKAEVCSPNEGAEKCSNIVVPLLREFYADTKLASPQCAAIKDTLRRYRAENEAKITEVSWDRDDLIVKAYFKKDFDKVGLFVINQDGILFKNPIIKYEDGILKAVVNPSSKVDDVFKSKPLYIVFGYPYYFTTATVVPKKNANDFAVVGSVSYILVGSALIMGLLFILLSPVLAFGLVYLRKMGVKKNIGAIMLQNYRKQALAVGITIAIGYPLLVALIGNIGNRLDYPVIMCISMFLMVYLLIYLYENPYAKIWKFSGFLFALLAFFVPSFLPETLFEPVNAWNCLAFGAGAAIGMIIFNPIIAFIYRLMPRPMKILTNALCTSKYQKILIFVPIFITAFAVVMILFADIGLGIWLKIALIILILLFIYMIRMGKLRASLVPAIICLLLLPWKAPDFSDNFTQSLLDEFINQGKVVYVTVQKPVSVSCLVSKWSFKRSNYVRNMLDKGNMVEINVAKSNPLIQNLRKKMDIKDNQCLHILYGSAKPNGEILPWFIENYTALKEIEKVKNPL